jgi:P4 family phage/plasmid primase-like protien
MTDWTGFVRFGVDLGKDPMKKTRPKFPNKWQELTTSKYNNQDNFAVLTGSINDIIVIDIDKDKKTSEMPGLEWFEGVFGELKDCGTIVTKSWSGGYHIFFKYNSKITSTAFRDLHIDVQSDGKCVFQGKNYDIIHDNPIKELTSEQVKKILEAGGAKRNKTSESDATTKSNDQEIEEDDKKLLKDYAIHNFDVVESDTGKVKIDQVNKCIIVSLNTRYCYFIGKEHTSNHQYIVFNINGVKRRCHDIDCSGKMYKDIPTTLVESRIKNIINKYVPTNEKEEQAIKDAEKECQNMIEKEHNDYGLITYDRAERIFSGASDVVHLGFQGNCNPCNIRYIIDQDGYYLHCEGCNVRYPRTTTFSLPRSVVPSINKVYIINNYYSNQFDETLDYNIEKGIFEDENIWYLVNDSMNGCKSGTIAELLKEYTQEFVYDDYWYYYDGAKWEQDDQNLTMQSRIIELYKEYYEKVKTYYRTKRTEPEIIKCINNLNNKLKRPQLKNEIIQESRRLYKEKNFFKKLNTEYHLLPFNNGVYDFLTREFRSSKREDYIEYTVGYDYNPMVNNPRVHKFIEQIIPDKETRDYILKTFSNCLNGRSSNEELLLLIGKGSNGKTQLLNLILNTFGELGEKLAPTLLTKPRKDASDANPELAKLMHKRFAFISEPEHNQTFNIAQLKELTGNEKIVARQLYKDSITFPMICHFYLACNELPALPSDLSPDDESLDRRLRIVEFKSKFVKEPKKENEYKVDQDLPVLMDKDITWRQTMMNILLSYKDKDIDVLEQVLIRTNKYKEESNGLLIWVRENLKTSQGTKLSLKDICDAYTGGKFKLSTSNKSLLKENIEHVFEVEYKKTRLNNIQQRVFYNLDFI